ncbi:MAG TPA: hypothetical protein VL362_02710 [Patescibacteria group bacterium]|jgi:hypothetical protein|nr:hypothetical protein [Patescibacteria group bacterium]
MISIEASLDSEQPDVVRAYRYALGEFAHELAQVQPGTVGFALFVGERKRSHRRIGETSASHTTVLTVPAVEPESELLRFQHAAIENRQVNNAVSTVGRLSPKESGRVLPSIMNPHHLTVAHLATLDHRIIAQAAIDTRAAKTINPNTIEIFMAKRQKKLGRLAADLSDFIGARQDYDELFGIDNEPVYPNATLVGFDITDSTALSAREHRKLLHWLEAFESQHAGGAVERIQFSGDGAFYTRHMDVSEAEAAASTNAVPPQAAHFAANLLDSYVNSEYTQSFRDDHPVRIAVANGWLSAEAGMEVGDTLWGLAQVLETMPRTSSSIAYSHTRLSKTGETTDIPL